MRAIRSSPYFFTSAARNSAFRPSLKRLQCRHCNRFKEGLKAEFRAALVKKYGEERIARMESLHKIGRKPSLLALKLLIEEIRAGKKTEVEL